MLRRILTASTVAAVAALGLPLSTQAAEMERVIVIDEPDVQKLNTREVPGFRTSDVIGTDVYGNAGKRIGEVEDFIMSRGGYFYAVIDIQDGLIEPYVDLTDDDLVVIPWNQLRVRMQEQQAAR